MRLKLLMIAAAGIAAFLTACNGGSTIDPQEIGDPERGREIFENGGEIDLIECSSCHSLDGTVKESGLHKYPSLQGVSERAGDRVSELTAVEYLRQSILDPSAYVVEGYEDNMEKGYKYGLSEEEVDDLVAFLLTQ
jgi:mono/diheme cytochrome c family protein